MFREFATILTTKRSALVMLPSLCKKHTWLDVFYLLQERTVIGGWNFGCEDYRFNIIPTIANKSQCVDKTVIQFITNQFITPQVVNTNLRFSERNYSSMIFNIKHAAPCRSKVGITNLFPNWKTSIDSLQNSR